MDKDIWTAARDGDIKEVRQHISNGEDINAKDKNGMTPLHHAAMEGREKITALLLDNGADADAMAEGNWTPLHYAACEGHEEIAALLLSKGADVDATADRDWTSLHLAARFGHEKVAAILLDKGADVNATEEKIEQTPLHYHHAPWYGFEQLAHKSFLDDGVTWTDDGGDANPREKSGQTPLHWAVANSHAEVVAMLLSKGADTDARDTDGETPLDIADDEEIKNLLREHP